MTHQANVIKSTVNAHILKQTIEQGLKSLGATRVEFNNYIFKGQSHKVVQLFHGVTEGRIEVGWPNNRKASVQLDGFHVDHILASQDAKGTMEFGKTIIRTLVTSRLEDTLTDFAVVIPLSAL